MAKSPHKKHSTVPSKEQLLAFIASQPGKVGTREIARAFGLKNDRRAELKRMLRDLADEGQVASTRRKLHRAGALPPITEADITGRDTDGELLATPTEWDEAEHGPAPKIHIRTPRKPRPGETAGIGDRAVLRVEDSGEGDNSYNGRIIRVIERAAPRVIGVFRTLPSGGARLVPVDKKQLGKEMAIAASQTKGAKDGDLIAASVIRTGRFGLPVAKVEELLGSLKSERAVSLIAIHAHGIPHTFPIAKLVRIAVATEKRERWKESRSDDEKKEPLPSVEDSVSRDEQLQRAIQPRLLKIGPISLAPSTAAGKSSGLTFHFSPYDVDAYAAGPYTVFVPWTALKPFLSPEGAAIFGGERPKGDDDDGPNAK